jgi:hypothetical protein
LSLQRNRSQAMDRPAPPPAIRVKSRWFKPAGDKTPEEQASALAFIAWRVAQQMLKRMRSAGFDIEPGPAYFGFMREVLVFLLAVADRLAYERMDTDVRRRFITALVLRVSEYLQDNEGDLLPPPEGASWAERFIEQFNVLQAHYAEFGSDSHAPPADGFTPDFAFYRYLGHRLEPGLPERDRRWVIDQVMAIEAPDAVALVQGAMRELHDPTPRATRRRTMSGE